MKRIELLHSHLEEHFIIYCYNNLSNEVQLIYCMKNLKIVSIRFISIINFLHFLPKIPNNDNNTCYYLQLN